MPRTTWTFACLTLPLVLALAPIAGAQDEELRVQGAELIKDGVALEKLFPQLLGLPLTQAEIDLFLSSVGPIAAWVEASDENRSAWNDIDEETETFLTDLRQIPVWKAEGVEIRPREFVALLMKLEMCRDIAEEGPEKMREEIGEQLPMLEQLLASGEVPPEQRGELEQAVEMLTSMSEKLKDYPAETSALLEKNEEALDKALEKVNSFSNDGGMEDEPGHDGEMPEDDGMGG